MSNCLNCQKELTQKEGKREKKFCDDNCRAAYHSKNNKKKEPKYVQYKTFKELQDRFNALTSFAKESEVGKKVIDEIKNTPSKLTVRDISPTGEVKQTYNLKQPFPPLEMAGEPILEPTHLFVPKNEHITIEYKDKPEIDIKAIEQRIKDLQDELKHPPKNPQIGLRRWVGFREDEIKQLKNQLP